MKILFTSTQLTTFVQEDLRILRSHFDVQQYITRGPGAPLGILYHLLHADATFTWFASVYSFFVVACARLLGKRSFVIIGGVDAAKYPEMNHGIWLNPWKAVLVRYAMRHAHHLLVVDPFLAQEAKRLAGYDGGNIEYVPTGYDAQVWSPGGQKVPMVLTVASCHNIDRFRVKGLDILLKTAARMPETRFTLIGIREELMEEVRPLAPQNVELIPFIERKALLTYYQQAKVYCQPSYVEGLPNSVCEAMLCGCIPVGTRVGGIPTAIGDAGYLVAYGDADGLAEALREALHSSGDRAQKARERIVKMFPLSRREETLVRLLREGST